MFSKLLLLFTIVPAVELYVLIKAGQHIGTHNTLSIIIITGILGAAFAKSQGAQIIYKIRTTMQQGQVPGQALLEGAVILVGGVLLLTPGFLTDILGFLLLIPFSRALFTGLILHHLQNKFQSGQWYYSTGPSYDHPPDPQSNYPEIENKKNE